MAKSRKRFVMLESTDLAEQTAHLSDIEFRAWVLIQAWGNENGLDENGDLHIAKSRLLTLVPNRRDSILTATRVVRELCTKIDFVFRSRRARVKKVLEGDVKWVISFGKGEEKQSSSCHTKKKEEMETIKEVSKPSVPRPAGAERHSKPPAVRGKPPTPTERARAVWPRLVEAARRYGGDPWPEKLGKGNLSILRARIGDGLSEDDLEAVIHGAIKRWGPANSETGWDPLTQLVPQTIYRPTKYEAHLQAGRGGRQSGVELELEKIRAARQREANREATA